LLDQGLPRSTGAFLAKAGWDVTHVAEIGMSRAGDSEILERAKVEQRVCVTLDADFHALLATSRKRGPSVIRIRREGLKAGELATLLQSAWPDIEEALGVGAMVTVTDKSIRVRKLPIVKD
jgi:predicted nuclease of predicted toxin-antitoxin system